MNPVKHSSKSRLLLVFVVAPLVILLSLFAWQVAGAHASLPKFLELALGLGLFGMSALSTGALMRRHDLSLRARFAMALGPSVGCACAGLGSITLALWPLSTAPLYFFLVSGVVFPVAVFLGIVGAARRGQRPCATVER
jgi:uncharacterized membrane protein